jgi:tetratricopeptide (TPR) repeat protein
MATVSIFVSHSHEDEAFCHALVDALRGAGADVWYDEHNLGAGHLVDVIQNELQRRSIFVVILSKAAFASRWVRRETTWAHKLANHDPTRIILPITAAPIEHTNFSGDTGWLFLVDIKRIEAPDYQPYPLAEAIGHTLHTLALTPVITPKAGETAKDLIARGKALLAQGKQAEALPHFKRATVLTPYSFDAWFNLGYACDALTRLSEALAAYEQALVLDPTSAPAWNSKGSVLHDLGRNQEALVAFEQVVALDPLYLESWYGQGLVLGSLGRPQEALAAFDQALALDPRHVYAWLGKGTALFGLGRHEDALVAFDQALRRDPWNPIGWRFKAEVLRRLGRAAEADEADVQAKSFGT